MNDMLGAWTMVADCTVGPSDRTPASLSFITTSHTHIQPLPLTPRAGGILTNKRNGERAVEESGFRYTIIRPCALTEEASNMPLQLDKGDTIKGKISRDDVVLLVAEALTNEAAANLTFEVKSTVPFSQQWTEEDAKAAPARDLGALLREVKAK